MNQSYSSVSGSLKKLPHVQTYKAQRILFGNPLDWDQYNEFRQLDKKERRARLKLRQVPGHVIGTHAGRKEGAGQAPMLGNSFTMVRAAFFSFWYYIFVGPFAS